jgi:hypothetical protein
MKTAGSESWRSRTGIRHTDGVLAQIQIAERFLAPGRGWVVICGFQRFRAGPAQFDSNQKQLPLNTSRWPPAAQRPEKSARLYPPCPIRKLAVMGQQMGSASGRRSRRSTA